ncbi:MAG: hypothetical protein ABI197_02180 [Granulicella sp.]
MSNSKDILWVRNDVFGNQVSLYVKTMDGHISKHQFDKYRTTEEHIFQALTQPDAARRSLDPAIGEESCVFEKFFPAEGQRFFTTAIYDDVVTPADIEAGGKRGRITTSYFPGRPNNSRMIGEIFWTKPELTADIVIATENAPLVDEEGKK